MVATTVTWNGTRIDAADSGSTSSGIGGGAGPGGEPDILYQGSGATPEDVSRKVGTSQAGFYLTTTITDISTGTGTYQTLVLKGNAANNAALELQSVPGVEFRAGSGTSAFAFYDAFGSDNYPEKGGFVFLCVDPNITGYRTGTTGSPALSSADYFGILGDFTATSKSENLVLSAVDVGDGYTITNGGGGNPTASFQDIADFNSILANRHGFFFALEGQNGAYGCYGTLEWGSSATPVDHQDNSGSTIFFLDGFYAAGWAGVLDNTENASTVISPSGNTYIGRGNTTTTDTRPVYNTSGANGSPTRTSETFKNFAQFNSASHFTYTSCDIETADLGQGAAEFDECTIRPLSASGVAMCNDPTFSASGIHDCNIVQSGSGHAFEITSTGTYTLTNLNFSGFGANGTNDAAIYNNSGGLVTINIVSGGSTPTIRNGAGASTTVNNNIGLTFTGIGAGNRIVITDGAASPTELFRVDNSTTGSETYSFDGGDAGTNVTVIVTPDASAELEILDLIVELPSSDSTIPLSLVSDARVYDNPT